MKYVKIIADTYNAAMLKLKMEYGDDTIPISHKYIKKGGVFNTKLFAKDVVELTAAIQEKRKNPQAKEIKKSKIDFTVDDSDPNYIDVSSHVRWQERGRSFDYTAVTYLYNWR